MNVTELHLGQPMLPLAARKVPAGAKRKRGSAQPKKKPRRLQDRYPLLLLVHRSGGATAARGCLRQRAAVRQRDGHEDSARVSILKRMGAEFDLVAGLDCGGFPAGPNQIRRRIHFEVPDLGIALGVLYFE